MASLGRVLIGTSGWTYPHWQGEFYPNDLSSADRLKYFSQYFKTVEINYSFYHLPKAQTYRKWYRETTPDFVFAVKASRFVTHIKRLKGVLASWENFLKGVKELKEKLGVVLLQFPPSFACKEETRKRLEQILISSAKKEIRLAIEVRNSSFEDRQFFRLLKKYNAALVISDSSKWKKIEKPELADFVYVRMHGPKALFSSEYSKKELEDLALKIKVWRQDRDVFVYFNNDAFGYAPKNAQTLIAFVRRS